MGRIVRAIAVALAGTVGALWLAYAVICLLTVGILIFMLLVALSFVSTSLAPMDVIKAAVALLVIGALLNAAFGAIVKPWK
jgi:hypothetical protein